MPLSDTHITRLCLNNFEDQSYHISVLSTVLYRTACKASHEIT